MKNGTAPLPPNEMERLISLAEFDIDYDSLNEQFKSLTRLAAKVAGTEISLINLIDAYTQWTISDFGISIKQMPREESVCQYTISGNVPLEVPDLSADERFMDRPYVTGDEKLRYYWGTPLQTHAGHNLGALCVLDRKQKALSPEKKEMLQLIADEIVSRLATISIINQLRNRVFESEETQKKLTHDIRGPVSGIVNMAQLITEQGKSGSVDDILNFIAMIQKSGHSLLELADEILSVEQDKKTGQPVRSNINLNIFRERLMKLYLPQATAKGVMLSVRTNAATETVPVTGNKLLQITGNLVSNAIKFTPAKGRVMVELSVVEEDETRYLQVKVTDTGIGISPEAIQAITRGTWATTAGTGGEKGFGFGLSLVKHLVEKLKGTLTINSVTGEGTSFVVRLPQ